MAARTTKIRHDQETRKKIQAAQIINRLTQCVMGEVELTAAQVSAAKTLLDKSLPSLQSVESDNTHKHDVSDRLLTLMKAIDGRTRTK